VSLFGAQLSSNNISKNTAVATFNDLPTMYSRSMCAFSPANDILGVATSREDKSSLRFYNLSSGKKIAEVGAGDGSSAIGVCWNNKINQIATGTSGGAVNVFYDSEISQKGAMIGAGRRAKRTDDLEVILHDRGAHAGEVLTPFALPMFKDPEKKTTKRKREEGSGAESSFNSHLIGSQNSASSNFTQAICDGLIKQKRLQTGDSRDPRAELFSYIDKNPAKANTGLESAYAKSDPKKILGKKTQEEEEK